MTDPTTVRITIRSDDTDEFLSRLGTMPHETKTRPEGLSELVFLDWDHPACHEFHFDGIPFTGFHTAGQGFDPHRMCGSGDASDEIYCDREGHLYCVVDEPSGEPNRFSAAAVCEYLHFEAECLERLGRKRANVGERAS